MDVLLGIGRVAELREKIDQILNAFARSGQRDLIVFIGDPDIEPGVLRQLDAALEGVERDGCESKAFGGGVEEIVAVRILHQVLPGVLDGRFVSALAPEIVRQIERSDDLIEELSVAFGGLRHGRDDYILRVSRPPRASERSSLRSSPPSELP